MICLYIKSSRWQERWNRRFTLKRWFLCYESKGLIVNGTFYFNGALFLKQCSMQQVIISQQVLYFSPENQRFKNKIIDYAHRWSKLVFSDTFLEIFGHRVLFWVGFSFTKWFGTAFREYISIFCRTERNSELGSLPRNGSERNSENLHLFGSTERNSQLCSLPQKGLEQNYGSLLLFLFHGTEFRVVFSFAEGFGMEFRDFLFRGTTGIPSEITICSVYSVFRGIIFLSEIPNPMQNSMQISH